MARRAAVRLTGMMEMWNSWRGLLKIELSIGLLVAGTMVY